MEKLITTRIRYGIFILTVTGALFGVLFVRFRQDRSIPVEQQRPVLLGGTMPISVSLADTPETREQGLSDTVSLAPQTGKLFIFNTSGRYGFWMNDMHYAIDIVWIDSTYTVIGITTNLAPDTYPHVFYPPADVSYVLELNAGEATTLGLSVGTKLSLEK
jgi:uncharacterized membrane protein (UPF0127 family)